MLGEDDHNDIDNEPINAEDLFGDNLDGENETGAADNNAENGGGAGGDQPSDAPQPERKKYRQVNRLANLNDLWLIDSKKENIRRVNGYFENIKFRKGRGQERDNLKQILQRFEYYGQQCYPKLCFKDFVEKVEYVSGKRTIRHVLQDIRKGNDDDAGGDDDDDEPVLGDNVGGADDFGVNTNDGDDAENEEAQPGPSPRDSPDKSAPASTPPAAKPTAMTDEIRDMIRKKREEAIAKRKQKLDDSMNTSAIHNDEPDGESSSEQQVKDSDDANVKNDNIDDLKTKEIDTVESPEKSDKSLRNADENNKEASADEIVASDHHSDSKQDQEKSNVNNDVQEKEIVAKKLVSGETESVENEDWDEMEIDE